MWNKVFLYLGPRKAATRDTRQFDVTSGETCKDHPTFSYPLVMGPLKSLVSPRQGAVC